MSLVSFDLRVEPRDPASSDEDDDEDSSRSGGGWFLGTVEPADDEGDSGTSKPLSPPPPPPVVVLDSSGLYGDPGLLVALFVALALPAVWFGRAELAEIGVVSIRVGWVLLAGCAVGGGPVLDGMVGVHDAWCWWWLGMLGCGGDVVDLLVMFVPYNSPRNMKPKKKEHRIEHADQSMCVCESAWPKMSALTSGGAGGANT